ncbi:MAG: type II toxin-antitoxin system RatA family toxin [Solirubrobacterales bacterium]
MGILTAERSIEIEAPRAACWAIIADLEATPEWQESMVKAKILESDSEGRGTLVEITSDAKVRAVTSRISFSYEPETKMTWEQEKGDLKWLKGSWLLEEVSDAVTRAVYRLEADTGRVLGLLVKGPVADKVKDMLTSDATEGLKRWAERRDS